MNEENTTQNVTFETQKKKYITRSLFENCFPNIQKINYCFQGLDYSHLRSTRDDIRKKRFELVTPSMDKEETTPRRLIRKKLYNDQPKDIFYQFDSFYPYVSPENNHFQLRKEIKFISDHELIFFHGSYFSIFNIITKKVTQLSAFEEENITFATLLISFDVYNEPHKNKIHIISGHYNASIKLEIFERITSSKGRYKRIYKEVINLYNDPKILINFVKFISEDQIFIADNSNTFGIFSLKEKKHISKYEYILPINYFCFVEKYNLAVAVGDFSEVLLFDMKSQKKIGEMKGHKDHGFICKYNGDYTVATGNQDILCKLWDIRKINGNSCYKTLSGLINAIGNIDFIDNDLMAFYENTDFIHIYDLKKDRQQTLSFFGDVPGSCVHIPTKKIYVGVKINYYEGILVYDKINKFNLL